MSFHGRIGGITMFRKSILPVVATIVVIASLAPAHADGGIIDVGQAFSAVAAPYINAVVNALVAALIGWVALRFKQKTGIDIDASHRDAFTRALQNQAASLIADGMTRLDNYGRVTVASPAMARSVNDLLASVPDAAKHFGLTPEFVAKRIVDMIPQVGIPAAAPVINALNRTAPADGGIARSNG